MLFRDPRFLGVIIDVTLRHKKDGERIVDVVKNDLIQHIRSFEEDDYFYLYHEDVTEVAELRGEQVHSVAVYQTDGYPFDILFALKQTLYVLAMEDEDIEKSMVLVTDRLSETTLFAIKKIAMLNKKDHCGCDILVVNLGTPVHTQCEGVKIHNGDNLFKILQEEFPSGEDSEPKTKST